MDRNKCYLLYLPSLFSFGKKMPYAQKGRHGYEWKVKNGTVKCCKMSEDFGRGSLANVVLGKIQLSLQQKKHQVAMASKFTTQNA